MIFYYIWFAFVCNTSRPKRRFGTRSSQHLANTICTATGSNDASTPTAVTTPASIGSKSIPIAAGIEAQQQQQQQQLVHLPATPLAALQKKNISVNSLPNVMEGVALGNGGRIGDGINGPSNNGVASGAGAVDSTGLSTVSSPTTMIAPTTVVDQQSLKMNGATAIPQNLPSTIDPKALIIEDEPTTEWTPEIPFKNVRVYYNNCFIPYTHMRMWVKFHYLVCVLLSG